MKLDSNNHSVFSLNYHLILVIKYRRKVLNDDISNRLKEIFEYISPNYNITLEEWEHDKDHIHVLFKHTLKVSCQNSSMLIKVPVVDL